MTFLCPPADFGSTSIFARLHLIRTAVLGVLTLLFSFALASPANAAVYTGTGTGSIPDGAVFTNHVCGTARDVQFAVSGFSGSVGSVSVSFAATHGWIGDLEATLIAPNGTSHLLFSRIGVNSGSNSDWGDDANFNSTYTFSDVATANIWATAASSGSDNFNMPSGSYRTQGPHPHANDNPGPAFTSLNSTFAAVPPANINGNWTLRFRDCAWDWTGSVTAASLTLNPTLAGDAELSGRVLTARGAGLRNAAVTISGGSLSEPRTVMTGVMGVYSFPGLDAGQTYIVSVAARRYFFETPTMVVNLDDNLANVDFISNQ